MGNQAQESERRKKIIFTIVLTLLVLSLFYAIYMWLQAPEGPSGQEGIRVKRDYVLMILQCLAGAIIIFLPQKVEDRFRIEIPNPIQITYFIFLFCAIYLGEVRNFYFRIPYWDVILHGFSAAMLGALGFILVDYLSGVERLNLKLSPFFVSFFAFCFSVTIGAIWEVYEFLADGLLGTNMQKFITAEGRVLRGRAALTDTMEDLIVDMLGTLVVVGLGYWMLRRRRKQTTGPGDSPDKE